MAIFKNSITKEEVQNLPLIIYEGEIIVIDSLNDISIVIDEITKYSILGFDSESKPAFKKNVQNKLSLIQIATPEKVYLFRINKIGLPDELLEILKSQKIKKIGLGIIQDLSQLKKFKKFIPAGFVELIEHSKKAEIEDMSLLKLTAIILEHRISKAQQLSNWDRDELSDAQIRYAATDAWLCLELYKKLI